MPGSRQAREQDLFHQYLELPTRERTGFLRAACDSDDDLRQRLERLLAAHFEAEGRATDALTESGAREWSPAQGTVVGPWRLVRSIGEGGMASVWLAERCDGLLGRRVAVKLPHGGWHRSILRERIEREREVLGTLNHPNIARLLDAGVSADGQPYLALEYVEGVRIDQYCRLRNLSIPARLHVFLQVTSAISCAHNRLIIHRDLKPSNILVTGDGAAHVLDFGIAKLLESGQAEETELTRFTGRALTLDYASPEQIGGKPLTVGSDVYSLGIILYELLTDTRPYALKRCSHAALEEAVLTMEPRRPSDVVSDRGLRRRLRGDLDTIIAKAVKKDPGERYTTVEQMAEDIRRHMENRPVLAQPDSVRYRCSKFLRRHSVAVAIGAAFAMVLCAAVALVAWQVRTAVAEKARAEAAKAFLLSMVLDAHSYWGNGRPLTAVDFLRQMRERAEHLPLEDPETRVEVLNLIAAGLLSQQDTTGAEAVIVRAAREAETLPPRHAFALRARLLRNWVRLFRGQVAQVRGDIDGLVADMQRAPKALPEDVAGTYRIRSAVALEEGDAATAEFYAAEALRTAERRLGRHHNQAVLALVDLCYAQVSNGSASALRTGEEARARALEAYGGRTTHPNVLKARVAYAQALAANGRLDEAITETRTAIDDATVLFGASSRMAGIDLLRLSRLQLKSGDVAGALASAERARVILSGHMDPGSAGFGRVLALHAEALAAAHRRAEAARDLAATFGPEHGATAAMRDLRLRPVQ